MREAVARSVSEEQARGGRTETRRKHKNAEGGKGDITRYIYPQHDERELIYLQWVREKEPQDEKQKFRERVIAQQTVSEKVRTLSKSPLIIIRAHIFCRD